MKLNQFKQVFLMGLIVGLIIVILGIASIVNYSINFYNVPTSSSAGGYLLAGIGCIFVGSMFLAKSIPAFIPIKQQTSVAGSCCPHCGAIIKEDATFCEKCNQQLD